MSDGTGAVVVGRRTFDVGVDPWGDVPYPVSCFVLTHETRDDIAMKSGTFTFVSDGVVSALRLARDAAGERDLLLMGGSVGQQLVPVLLGAGIRLFDHLGPIASSSNGRRRSTHQHVTHLRFRVVK